MPARPRPERILRDVKGIIEDCLREGYFPPDMPSRGRAAHTEAASRLMDKYGFGINTAWSWIKAANKSEWQPNYDLFRPFQYAGFTKGTKTLPAYRPDHVLTPEGRIRLAVIGDAHDSPALPDKDRFCMMGRWAAEGDFDEVIQIGDFLTLDSLTRHAAPGTKTFAELPCYKEDLESLDEALNYFDRGLDGKIIQKTVTLGNHEDRARRYEDTQPQMAGAITAMLHDVFRSHGWRIIPFGEITFRGGVGLTHHPMNALGKAYGGKTANQRTGNDSIFSLIHGHDHKLEIHPSAKIGPMGYIDIISAGCSLPHGYVEDYASHGPSGWAWGVCDFTIRGGSITDKNFTSMLTLEERFG